jgi:hypothetical protein
LIAGSHTLNAIPTNDDYLIAQQFPGSHVEKLPCLDERLGWIAGLGDSDEK